MSITQFIRRYSAILLMIFCCSVVPTIDAAAAVPAIETFFKNAAFSGAILSPNGRFVALRVASNDKESRASLAVIDLETMTPKSVAKFEGYDIGAIR